MTLGCGGYGGNITSDNISPIHLLNIKRLAYETTSAHAKITTTPIVEDSRIQPIPVAQAGGSLKLSNRIDQFLATRGYGPLVREDHQSLKPTNPQTVQNPSPAGIELTPVPFVCEQDVRLAVKEGQKISINAKTIVTPAANDLANEHSIFIRQD